MDRLVHAIQVRNESLAETMLCAHKCEVCMSIEVAVCPLHSPGNGFSPGLKWLLSRLDKWEYILEFCVQHFKQFAKGCLSFSLSNTLM